MPTPQTILFVTLFVAVDAVIVLAIGRMIGSSFKELTNRWPARPHVPGALRNEFQSFSLGLANLGGCVHVVVDEHYLHLEPAMLARWLGMKKASIPWNEIKLEEVGKRVASCRLGELWLRGPSWALRLADPGREGERSGVLPGVQRSDSAT